MKSLERHAVARVKSLYFTAAGIASEWKWCAVHVFFNGMHIIHSIESRYVHQALI
jgi:aminoglycoside phosphotransferase (APT) family kinase protein